METAKSQLKELLARNQVQIAIEILKDLTQHDVFKLNNVVLLSSQWHKYLEFLEKGNMDSRDLTLQFNQIHIALSHLIDALDDDVILDLPASFWDNLPKPIESQSVIKSTKNPISPVLGSVLGLMVLLFIFWQWQKPPLSHVTVSVFQKGSQKKVFCKGFYVIMYVRGEAKRTLLGEYGQAVFSNLFVGDTVRLDIESTEPFRPVNPNFVYSIPKNGEINLTVQLEGAERVFGRIKTEEGEPLKDVTVAIGALRSQSDSIGFFQIYIPDSLQFKEQTVDFYKKGFELLTTNAVPQSQQPLPITMKRTHH